MKKASAAWQRRRNLPGGVAAAKEGSGNVAAYQCKVATTTASRD